MLLHSTPFLYIAYECSLNLVAVRRQVLGLKFSSYSKSLHTTKTTGTISAYPWFLDGCDVLVILSLMSNIKQSPHRHRQPGNFRRHIRFRGWVRGLLLQTAFRWKQHTGIQLRYLRPTVFRTSGQLISDGSSLHFLFEPCRQRTNDATGTSEGFEVETEPRDAENRQESCLEFRISTYQKWALNNFSAYLNLYP